MTNDKWKMTNKSYNSKFITLLGFWIFFGFWILSFGFPAIAVVDIGEIGVGARPLGMGNASIGGMDDATAIFTNPAALTLNRDLNIISMSGSLMTDINYLMVGAAEDFPFGRLGIGYLNASITGIPITDITGVGSTQAVTVTGNADYGSSIIFFSYGSKLGRFLRGNFDNVSVGGNLKYFLQGFTGGPATNNPLHDANGNGMDMDVGILVDLASWINVGLTLNNCLPYSAGGKFTWEKNAESESIPLATRVGMKMKLLGDEGMRQSQRQAVNLMIDYETGRGDDRPGVMHGGLEFWPIDILALRVGIDQKPKATETGKGVDNNLTGGIGIEYHGFTFDYAYHQFGDLADNTSHFFSFGYRGLDKKKPKKIIPVKEVSESVLPVAEVVTKPELKTFVDVTKNYWARNPIEYLATLGIMNGYPDGTFKPDKPLTRGELAALLVKAKGFEVKPVKNGVFKDIKPNNWVAPYVRIAVNRGYVKGYPDGTYQPNRIITRAEAATVFAKFAGIYVKPKISEKAFPDMKRTHWASPSVAAAKHEGLYAYLVGKDFEPKAYLTRAEAAEILSKTKLIKDKIKSLISGQLPNG
jgi:hypothetical protein